MRTFFDLSLYLVLDPGLCARAGLVETAVAAVSGGVTLVQLRNKDADTAHLVETGLALRQALAGSGALLIVNDDTEAAVRIGADGLHVGRSDMDAQAARARIGTGRILGVSVETEARAAAIDPRWVDYAGVGPVFATATKPDHEPPIGLEGLSRLVAACKVPAVAIGGLKAAHVGPVLATGAQGIAVVSAICGRPDPAAAARIIADEIRAARAV